MRSLALLLLAGVALAAPTGGRMVFEAKVTTAAGRAISLVFQTQEVQAGQLPPATEAAGWLESPTDKLMVKVVPGAGRVFVLRAQRLLDHLDPGDTVETSTLLVAVPDDARGPMDARWYLHVDPMNPTKPLYEARAVAGAWRKNGPFTSGKMSAELAQVAPAGDDGGWVRIEGRLHLR